MVDVSAKPLERREAVAEGDIWLQPATLRLIEADQLAKGNVLAASRLAGVMAAKQTPALIPLCHSLPLTDCRITFQMARRLGRIRIQATARTIARTGVEMEALTAVSVAALTIYDMCKAVDKAMRISDIHLISKTKQPV